MWAIESRAMNLSMTVGELNIDGSLDRWLARLQIGKNGRCGERP